MSRTSNIARVLSVRRECGTRNTLVCVRCLLDADLLVRRLAAAAADAEQPEETRSHAKCNGEPDNRKHLLAQRGLDVVRLERSLEDASEESVNGCSGDGGGEDEDRLSLLINILVNATWKKR
jgi:hypothetical protein